MKMFFSWKALELHHESMKKTEIYCNSSNILHESNITRSCRWHLAYILHSLLLYVNKHQNILNYQNTFMALLENQLGKLSKIKTTKLMENSICQGGGSFSICYHESFLLYFKPFQTLFAYMLGGSTNIWKIPYVSSFFF